MVSVTEVSRAMKGIGFPADRQKCVSWAKQHGASSDVVHVLEHMPDTRYNNMSDIWYAIS